MGNKKNSSPTCRENLKSYFSQYCDSTSIHGMRYLGENGRFIIEKLTWTTVIATVCSLCLYLIYKTYYKWTIQPVLVSFATKEMPIWEIPFPAITICPEVKCDSSIFNYTAVADKENKTDDEIELFASLSMVCLTLTKDEFYREIVPPSATLPFEDLKKVFPDHRNQFPVVSKAYWLGKEYPMQQLTTSYTRDGICYTFNMLSPVEILTNGDNGTENRLANGWSLIDGYESKNALNAFPERSYIAGEDGAFVLYLYTNHSHIDYLCNDDGQQGFKVTLHHPTELPTMDRHFQLNLDQSMHVEVKPHLIKVAEELKPYNPAARNCYYPDEKKLAFYKYYSQNNCLNECLSNYTLATCKCLGFYMVGVTNNTPICGSTSYSCLDDSKVQYVLKQDDEDDTEELIRCDCLPSCTSLKYETETSQSALEWRQTYKLLSLDEFGIKIIGWKDHMSSLKVYFKERYFLPIERNELYGYVDFFSNIGGLMGLFIGISLTSLIEIVYYLTLRLACNIKKFGRRFWSGDPELVAMTQADLHL